MTDSPWKRIDTATRTRDLIIQIAQNEIEGALTFRLATAGNIYADYMEVEFADEPGNIVSIPLQAMRPKNSGTNVEIAVRNGTEFYLNRVFGETVYTGSTPADPVVPGTVIGLALSTANRVVTATWTLLDGATVYEARRSKDSTFATGTTVVATNTNQVVVANLTAGDVWYWQVRAGSPAGFGPWTASSNITVAADAVATSAPAVPTGLALTSAERAITASWSVVTDADNYTVRRSTDSTFATGVTTTVVAGNQLVVPNLTAGNVWYFQVRANNEAGSSAYSGSANATVVTDTPAPTAPAVPTGLTAVSAERAISVMWGLVSNADSYDVRRSKDSTFATGVTNHSVIGNQLVVPNLVAGDVWYFQVRSSNLAGQSAYSSSASATVSTDTPAPTTPGVPNAPVLVAAERAITATWDVVTGATSYTVQRATNAGFTTGIVTQVVIGNQLVVSNLTPGDGWWFRVLATNSAGSSAYGSSASIVVNTDTPAPSVPPQATGLAVTAGERSLTASWTHLPTADYYELQWSLDNTFATGITTQLVQGTNFTRNNLTTGNVWYYRVRGVNTAGNGTYSSTASGTVATGIPAPAGAPVQVVGMAASTAERSITVTWSPQAVADSYEIERSKSATFATGNVLQEVSGSILTIHNLIIGEGWYFRVRAKNAAGTGTYSATLGPITVTTDTPAPGSPGQVTGLALTTIPKQIVAKWNALTDAYTYQVDRSPDSTFVTGTVTETVETNALTVLGLDPGSTWYFRVRGVNTTGNGTYSANANITVMQPNAYTDGDAPASSPTATVTAGLGTLTATWPAIANADRVTYEVYLGTTSGFTTMDATTKLGETDGTTWVTDKLPNGTKLTVGTTYYIRVRARDADGTAALGAQGSAQLTKLDLGVLGDVQYQQIKGDGSVPGTPAAPIITSGIGYLYAKWTRPTSADPLTYEVHVSSVSAAFVPDANTLSLTTDGLFAFIRKQGPGASNADLVYGTTYYVKIIAKDIDGVSTPSTAGSGFTVKAVSSDIALDIGGTNHLLNSSFEVAGTPYSARPGGSAAHLRENTAGGAYSGSWYIKSTFTGTSDSNLFTVDLTPTAPGKWVFSLRVRANTGWTAGAFNVYPDGSPGGYVISNPSVAAVVGQYVIVHVVVTVTAAQVGTAYPYVLRSASAITGQSVNVDAIQWEQGEVPTAYGPRPDEILAGTITQTELASGAVTAAKTAIAAIDSATGNLVANSVAAVQIQTGVITAVKLYAGATEADLIQANNIAAGAITTSKMTAGTINGDRITAGTISATKLYAGAVAADLIQTNNLAAGVVTAAKIYSGVVEADKIQTSNLAAQSVTAAKIYSGAVMADRIQANNIATGIITAASAIIADGAIQNAKIENLAVTSGKINDLAASKITTDTLSATLTVSGVIRSSAGTARVEMSSAGLYAYNSGGGTTFSIDSAGNAYFQGNIYAVNGTFTGSITSSATITGGAFVGASFSTGSSGYRMIMGPSLISSGYGGMSGAPSGGPWPGVVFYVNSTVKGLIAHDGNNDNIIFQGVNNVSALTLGSNGYVYASGSAFSAPAVYDSGYRVYSPVNPPSFPVTSVNGYTGSVSLTPAIIGAATSGHTHSYVDSSHLGTYHTNSSLDGHSGYGGNQMHLSDDGSVMRIHSNGNVYRCSITRGLAITKNFVIDHPSPDKTDKYLVHACLEGPESAVYYRGKGRTQNGIGWVELPDFFEDLTEEADRTVQVTQVCNDVDWTAMLSASYPEDGRFYVLALGGNVGLPDCGEVGCTDCGQTAEVSFFWEVKAIRKDVTRLIVEPKKSENILHGDGPYTYLVPV